MCKVRHGLFLKFKDRPDARRNVKADMLRRVESVTFHFGKSSFISCTQSQEGGEQALDPAGRGMKFHPSAQPPAGQKDE